MLAICTLKIRLDVPVVEIVSPTPVPDIGIMFAETEYTTVSCIGKGRLHNTLRLLRVIVDAAIIDITALDDDALHVASLHYVYEQHVDSCECFVAPKLPRDIAIGHSLEDDLARQPSAQLVLGKAVHGHLKDERAEVWVSGSREAGAAEEILECHDVIFAHVV